MSELLAMRGADAAIVAALVRDSNRMNFRSEARGQHRGAEPEAGGTAASSIEFACVCDAYLTDRGIITPEVESVDEDASSPLAES